MIVLNGQHRCKLLYVRNQKKWIPMKRRGHRGVNLLVLSGFSYMLLPERPLLALLAWTAWFLEPIPDKDQDVGLTHRGTSHSFFAAALAGVIVGGAGWLVGKHLLQPGMHALFAMPIGASRSTFMWWASRVAALDASTLATVGFWIGAGSFLMHYLGDIITTGGAPTTAAVLAVQGTHLAVELRQSRSELGSIRPWGTRGPRVDRWDSPDNWCGVRPRISLSDLRETNASHRRWYPTLPHDSNRLVFLRPMRPVTFELNSPNNGT